VDISFVILTWNSERHIRTCVEHTLEDTTDSGLECEFFVVDNGSTDQTKTILASLEKSIPGFRAIYLEKNCGTTYSRNFALKKASGRFICILDSDAYPTSGCVKKLKQCIENDPTVGIAVPRLIYPDGRHQKSVDRFPTLGGKLRRAFLLKRIEAQESPWPRGYVPYAISAFWMISRRTLEKVGLLDERIFYAPEDVDYCLSVWKKGFRVFHEPAAVAVHDAQEKSRRLVPNRLTLSHLAGLFYMFRKHGYLFRPPFLAALNDKAGRTRACTPEST